MTWWKRLFGAADPDAPPPRPTPMVVSVIPGKLTVRVYAHDAGVGEQAIPCWSYVSDGLRAHGQQEIVFTLQRRPSEAPQDFPREPLEFFAAIHPLAVQGRHAGVGSYTGFLLESGFLGFQGKIGFAHVRAETQSDVDYPEDPLAAIFLRGAEVDAVEAIGTYRVLALLGEHYHYYPTPFWSDRDRPLMLTQADLEASLLAKVPSVALPGATVSIASRAQFADEPAAGAGVSLPREGLMEGPVILHLTEEHESALREILQKVPAEAPFALLTTPAREANVRLVWRPGQTQVHTIYPHGSPPSRITGGFLFILPHTEPEPGASLLEDGFALRLAAEQWQGLREALLKGEPWQLQASGDRLGFSVEWDRPGRVKMVLGRLYQADEVLRERVASIEEFAAYTRRVVEEATKYLGTLPPGPGQALTLVIAVRPGREFRLWADTDPVPLGPEVVAALQDHVRALAAPEVHTGPVAFAAHMLLWGGPADGESCFPFIPREWQEACAGQGGIIPDAPLAQLWP